ncbi:MAG: PHP domain-containing protein [Proteobacteria bacterium]|nr:PHP domain-containing protein [Pseudomonadota bacterium]
MAIFDALKPGARFDLHLHTARSDGAFPLDEVLARCAAGKLDVVAITDHDLVPELDSGVQRIGDRDLTVLAGAEVTGQHDGHELHLLVYFAGEVPEGFRQFCTEQTRGRAERYAEAVKNLALPLPEPTADAHRGERALTRFHLAQALVASGHATNVGDAFARFLGHGHGNVPRMPLTFVDAIRVARSYGGVTSWAHPPPTLVERYVAEFAAAGLQGLESLRPGVKRQARNVYKKAAKRHGLFATGGSDWHGWHHPDELGLHSVRKFELTGFLDALLAA